MEPGPSRRLELMSHLPRLKRPDCVLHTIDVGVTLEERIAAWQLAGGDEASIDDFRAACALTVRAPPDTDVGAVETLDLENTNLRHIDLSPYKSLKHLRCGVGLCGRGRMRVP